MYNVHLKRGGCLWQLQFFNRHRNICTFPEILKGGEARDWMYKGVSFNGGGGRCTDSKRAKRARRSAREWAREWSCTCWQRYILWIALYTPSIQLIDNVLTCQPQTDHWGIFSFLLFSSFLTALALFLFSLISLNLFYVLCMLLSLCLSLCSLSFMNCVIGRFGVVCFCVALRYVSYCS